MLDPATSPGFRSRLARIAARSRNVVVAFEPDGSAVRAIELLDRAESVRRALGGARGRIGIEASNDIGALAAIHGAWLAGSSVVLVSPLTPDAEVERRLHATGAAALVTPGDEPKVRRCDSGPTDEREAAVIFTSGTTGVAKAASIPFEALEASVRAIGAGLGLPPGGRELADPPRSPSTTFVSLAHMGGLLATQSSWSAGKPILLVPKFAADVTFDLVRRFRLTTLALTPAMVFDLAHFPAQASLEPVRSVSVGTAALPDATRLAFENRFGAPILRNYGQTEFTGAIAFERYDDVKAGRRPPMSVGRVAPGVEVRIVDSEACSLAPGEVGEIWARGASSMTGYLDAGGVPSSGTEPGGWVATGDLGTLDHEGFLSVVGRLRDVLICGGFNVYPAVVETAINELPGVEDCAVAGRTDTRLGDVPVVAVVSRRASVLDLDELRAALRTRLAAYELPRDLCLVNEIPRTTNGKVDRPAVAALFDLER